MRSCVGVEGAHAICAIDGRRCWNRCRMWEVGLVDVWKRLLRDWWSLKGRRSWWRRKPCCALRMAAAIVMTKSGAARVRGQRMPRPPEARPSWLMRMAEDGIVGWLVRVVRKVDMMSSMSDVRGPFHSSHFGLGSLIGRLWRMSDESRCGSFCMRHWENRRSCVCSSVMEVVSDDIFSFTFEMQEEKKVVAKEAEPTGWPRSRKPVVSSTGRGRADLSVGCGRVENSAIVAVIEVARVGLTV